MVDIIKELMAIVRTALESGERTVRLCAILSMFGLLVAIWYR